MRVLIKGDNKMKKILISLIMVMVFAWSASAADLSWYTRLEAKDRMHGYKKDVYTVISAKDFIPLTNLNFRYREYKTKDETDIFADIKLGKLLPDKLHWLQGFGIRLQHEWIHSTANGKSGYEDDRVYVFYRLKIWKGKLPWQK
jgi:hypothetical protein